MQSAVMPQYVVSLSVRPSVCLPVTFRNHDHIDNWNTLKIVSRPNSLRTLRYMYVLRLIATSAIWSNGNISKNRMEWGGVIRIRRRSATAEKQRVSCACLLWLANWSCNAQNTAESQRLYYFWHSNALIQEVLAENAFCHEIATQGHSRSFICNNLPVDKG